MKELLVGVLFLLSVVQVVYSQSGNAITLSSADSAWLEVKTATFGGALTMEGWIKKPTQTATTFGGPIFFFSNQRWGNELYDIIELGVEKNSNYLYLNLANSRNDVGGANTYVRGPLPADWANGDWTHVAATISLGGEVFLYATTSTTLVTSTIYIAANATAERVVVPSWTSRSHNFIGHSDTETFDGILDELRLFTEVRSVTKLNGVPVLEPASEPQLVLWYTFDDSTIQGVTVVNQALTTKCNSQSLDASLTMATSRKRVVYQWMTISNPPNRISCQAWGDVHFVIDASTGSNFDYQNIGCHWFLSNGDIQIQSYDINCVLSGAGWGYPGATCQAGYAFLIFGEVIVVRLDWAASLLYLEINGVRTNQNTIYLASSGTTVSRRADWQYITVDVPGLYTFTLNGAVGPWARATLDFVSIAATTNPATGVRKGTCIQDPPYPVDNGQCMLNLPIPVWWPPVTCPTDAAGQECSGVRGTPLRSFDGCQCICKPGYTGPECGTIQCTYNCAASGCHGTCVDKGFGTGTKCQCDNMFIGADCCTPVCPDCAPNGHCDTSSGVPLCVCDPSWTGSTCKTPICESAFPSLECSGHGSCGVAPTDPRTPVCTCLEGWKGPDCNTPDCTYLAAGAPECGNHGTCSPATNPPTCICRTQWEGRTCDTPKCQTLVEGVNCSGNGICDGSVDPPVCICTSFNNGIEAGWEGTACGTPHCLGEPQCSNNGLCNGLDMTKAPKCDCTPPWFGANCSQLPACPAPNYTDWSSPTFRDEAMSFCNNSQYVSEEFTVACLFDTMTMNTLEPVVTAAETSAAKCRSDYISGARTTPCDPVCPNFCSLHGTCAIAASGDVQCQCDPGYHGSDCSYKQNARCMEISWDGGDEKAPINPIFGSRTVDNYLNWQQLNNTQESTKTNLETSRSIVAYLYHDFRPQSGLCVAYDDVYLVVLTSRPGDGFSGHLDYSIDFTNPTSFTSPVTIQSIRLDGSDRIQPSATDVIPAGQTSIQYTGSFDWSPADNDAISFGMLPQGEDYCIQVSFDVNNAEGLDTFYYATAAADGTTELVPVPLDKLNGLQICSKTCNSQCGAITDCGTCAANAACGWCDEEAYCFEGTPAGPTFGTCGTWRWATDATTSRVTFTDGLDAIVAPSTVNVFLGQNDVLPINVYVNVPAAHPVHTLFLVDLTSNMGGTIALLSAKLDAIVTTITNLFVNSKFGIASFSDKPVTPYGWASRNDFVAAINQPLTSDATKLSASLDKLALRSGADPANAQLEALLYMAQNTLAAGYTDNVPFRLVVVLTNSPYHTPVGSPLKPNNLDGVIDADEDYPAASDVKDALIKANIIPIFVSTSDEAQAAYSALVASWGLGLAYSAQSQSLPEVVIGAMQDAFRSVMVVPAAGKYIKKITVDGQTQFSIYPQSYDSVSPLTRVKFTIDLDLAAQKRDFSPFDYSTELIVPGYGFVTVNFRQGDDRPRAAPVDSFSMVQDGRHVIQLEGGSIYVPEEDLDFIITQVPARGSLYQFSTTAASNLGNQITSVDTLVLDPLHRLVYVPAAGESCYGGDADYVGAKRGSVGQCPYASMGFKVRDPCGADSATVSFNITVVPATTNNPPVPYTPSKPTTTQNTEIVITLDGWDKDNDKLTFIVTSTTTKGKLYECVGADRFSCVKTKLINTTDTPYTLTNQFVVFVPQKNDFGYDYDTFNFKVWDGHNATQLGYSKEMPVCIDVIYTNLPPSTKVINTATIEDIAIVVPLSCLDPDSPTGQAATCKVDQPPTSGTLYNSDGSEITTDQNTVTDDNHVVTYVPNSAVYTSYVDTFTYSANDGQESSTSSTVTVSVSAVNHPPAVDSNYEKNAVCMEDSSVTITLATASDLDGDALYWAITVLPKNGDLYFGTEKVTLSFYELAYIMNPAGSRSIRYVPNKDYNGVDTFVFTVSDRADEVSDSRFPILINVRPVNDAPVLTVADEIKQTYLNLTGFSTYSTEFTQISVSDIDAGLNPVTFTIQLVNGSSGAISLQLPAAIANNPATIQRPDLIVFTTKIPQINAILNNGLTWSVNLTVDSTSYPAVINMTVNDNGYSGQVLNPLSDNDQIVINATGVLTEASALAAVAKNGNGAATGGAIAGAAAGAAAVAGVFAFLKKKNALGEVPNPWEEIDMLDAAMTNPLHVEAKTFENNALFEQRA